MPADSRTAPRRDWHVRWALSLRARLALWYGLACGVCTVVIALVAYVVLARVTRDDADRFLADTAGSIALALQQSVNALAPVPEGAHQAPSTGCARPNP